MRTGYGCTPCSSGHAERALLRIDGKPAFSAKAAVSVSMGKGVVHFAAEKAAGVRVRVSGAPESVPSGWKYDRKTGMLVGSVAAWESVVTVE